MLLLGWPGALPAAQSAAKGPPFRGDADLFNRVAVEHKANRERVLTWRGVVAVSTEERTAGRPESRAASRVTFAYDRPTRAVRWTWKNEEEVSIRDGFEQVRPDPVFAGAMRKEGAFYELGPLRPRSIKGEWTVRVASSAAQPFTPPGDNFDPAYWLDIQGERVEGRLAMFYDRARKGLDLSGVAVSRRGTQVTVEMRLAGALNQYEVDLAQGASVVSYLASTPEGAEERQTWRYAQRGGVWIPEELVLKRTDSRQRGFWRKMEWIENVVNEPLPDDEFSLPKLGLRRGDHVYDANSRTDYVVQGAEYPPAEDGSGLTAPEGWRPGLLVLAANGAVVLLIFGLLVARKWFSKKGAP